MFYGNYPVTGGGGVSSLNGLTGALTLVGAGGITITPNSPVAGDITITGTGGTVTSVGLADNSASPIYSISGSPVTSSGTLAFTLMNQAANKVFAGPATGSSTQPNFRSLVIADLSFAGQPSGVATLDPSGKVPASELPSTLLEYQGLWNPTTNTPTLQDSTGTNAFVYQVTTAFAGPIAGLNSPTMTNFQVGNLVIFSSAAGEWQQADSLTGVTSVNGAVGAVTVNAINQLTGVILAGPASGSQSKVASFNSGAATSVQALFADGIGGAAYRSIVPGDIPALPYANQSLSNLSSTAVNVDLNMSGNNINNAASINNNVVTTGSQAFNIGVNTTVYLHTDPMHPDEIQFTGIGSILPMNTAFQLTGSNLPAPLTTATTYYSSGGFQGTGLGNDSIRVWSAPSGPVIQLTSTGSGLMTANFTSSTPGVLAITSNVTATSQEFDIDRLSANGIIQTPGSGVFVVDIGNLQLHNAAAVTMLTWSGTGVVDFNSNRLTSVADPINPQDAATKAYVDSAVSGSAATNNKELFTLNSTNITNQFIDLAHVAKTNSIDFVVRGSGSQIEGASFDYSVNYTGGSGGNTRITFLNGLATGGASALVATDVVVAKYQY